MAYQTPKTNWQNTDIVTPVDLNRIEGNILELKKAATIDIQDTAGNFTATNVEDALQELAGNVKNGKTAIANAITAMGQSATGNDTFDTLAAKIRNISKDATAAESDVLSGKTFYAGGSKKTGTMPNRGAVIITPGTANQTIAQGYHNGSGYVKGDANLVASNILSGKSIFGVAGNVVPRKFASGTAVTIGSTAPTYIQVSGLSFTPLFAFAVISPNDNVTLVTASWICSDASLVNPSNMWVQIPSHANDIANSGGGNSIIANGFTLYLYVSGGYSVKWIAFA